jgi:hypothetical protein
VFGTRHTVVPLSAAELARTRFENTADAAASVVLGLAMVRRAAMGRCLRPYSNIGLLMNNQPVIES